MSSLSSIALAGTSLFYLAVAYFNVCDQQRLLQFLDLSKGYEITPLAVMSMRCFGVAAFILAFIMGHMIKHKDKHKAALRTSLMTSICFAGVYAHRLHIDEATPSAAGVAACTKMLHYNVGLILVNLVAFVTLPKEVEQPKKNV